MAALNQAGLATASKPSCCQTDAPVATCFHCQEPLSDYSNLEATINGRPHLVCCHGCKSAVEFIAERGLDDFYQHRDTGLIAAAQTHNHQHSKTFTLEDWSIEESQSGYNVVLSVPGLYCSSCAWLVKQALDELKFDLEASVQVDSKQVSLAWKDPKENLEIIIHRIEQLGYPVFPIGVSENQLLNYRSQENDLFLKRILVSGLGTMQVMTYAVAHYLGAMQNPNLARFLELIAMLVATVVVMYSGQHFFSNAWRDIKNRHLGMDVPVALAVGAAFFPSVVQTLMQIEGRMVYYDSAVMFIFFLLLGRYIEARARHSLIESDDALNRSLPTSVEVSRTQDDRLHKLMLAPKQIQLNDEIKVSAGDIIPCDAIIIEGEGEVDESLLTGESHPVFKSTADNLLAGTQLISGRLLLRSSGEWTHSSLASIDRLVQRGKHKEVTTTSLIGLLNRYFVITVLVLTVLVAIAWYFIQADRIFEVVLAMLIATCPCAFALAAPVGSTVASNVLRRHGVLLANADALTNLANSKHWWFDKTGTLTKGKPAIINVTTLDSLNESACLDILASLEFTSRHPLAKAFSARKITTPATDINEIAGHGICGNIGQVKYYAGNAQWIAQIFEKHDVSNDTLNSVELIDGCSRVYLATSQKVLACVQLMDENRSGLEAMLHELEDRDINTTLISGDNSKSVNHFAQSLPFSHSYAGQTPQQKLELLIANSKQHKIVMVGDGANDAPILANADVSIALASGSELSQAQADILLLNHDLRALLLIANVAKKSQRITQQNLIWAIGYNAAILPLAAFGFLTPWIAAIGMSLSSLGVVLNAARIRRAETR